MKKLIKIILAITAVMTTVSCGKEITDNTETDAAPLTFIAEIEDATRTSYGTEDYSATGTYSLPICWTTGDTFRVWSSWSYTMSNGGYQTMGGEPFADYTVVRKENSTSGKAFCTSEDPLTAAFSGEPIKEESEAAYIYFYALYPAPGTTGTPQENDIQRNVLTFVLPTEQGSFATNPASAMKYAYMFGYSMQQNTDPTRKNIFISFKPAVTTYHLWLYGDSAVPTTLKSVRLETATSGAYYLTGTYKLTISNSSSQTLSFPETNDQSKQLTATLETPVLLPSDPDTEDPFLMLMFAIPQANTNLTLYATIEQGGVEKTISAPISGTVQKGYKLNIKSTLTTTP